MISLPDSFATVVPIRNSLSASSRGREGLCTLSRGGWLYLRLVRIIQIPKCVEDVEL